jgi:hypothetical protein
MCSGVSVTHVPGTNRCVSFSAHNVFLSVFRLSLEERGARRTANFGQGRHRPVACEFLSGMNGILNGRILFGHEAVPLKRLRGKLDQEGRRESSENDEQF